MSALDQLLHQYRAKAQISKSRKRPRESTVQNYVVERTIKGKTEKNNHVVIDINEGKNDMQNEKIREEL
tara:strand:+ start:246 stop:452 length:207 start_codon:yes stop_codon:yes gene_type:complete